MSRPNQAPRVLFSNANLAQTANVLKPPHRPILSPRAVGAFAARAGYDGVDWHPAYPAVPGSPGRVAAAVRKGNIQNLALHQSFNEDPYKTELVGLQQRVLASKLGQKMIMPGTRESVTFMADVQQRIGQKLPIVYYPNARAEDDYRMLQAGGASMNLFQPTAHVLEKWDVDSAVGLQDEARVRGYGTCFDTHHAQRGGKFGLLLAGAAPISRAIHLAVARYDMPDQHVDIADNLNIALSGDYTGAIGDTFDAIDEQGNLDYVVVEAPIEGIMRATGFMAMQDIVKVYADIAEGVHDRYGLSA